MRHRIKPGSIVRIEWEDAASYTRPDPARPLSLMPAATTGTVHSITAKIIAVGQTRFTREDGTTFLTDVQVIPRCNVHRIQVLCVESSKTK